MRPEEVNRIIGEVSKVCDFVPQKGKIPYCLVVQRCLEKNVRKVTKKGGKNG